MVESETALLLLFKRPQPGVGKQRLALSIGRDNAFGVAELLLDCALNLVREWSGPVFLAPAEAGDIDWCRQRVPRATDILLQPQGNLGLRMGELDLLIRQRGYGKILIIGSDCPGLTIDALSPAAQRLEQYDYVFLDADDGGVVMMGAARPWPEMTALPWSQDNLGSALKARCQQFCAPGTPAVWSGECFSDMDTLEDCRNVLLQLEEDTRMAQRLLCQRLTTLCANVPE